MHCILLAAFYYILKSIIVVVIKIKLFDTRFCSTYYTKREVNLVQYLVFKINVFKLLRKLHSIAKKEKRLSFEPMSSFPFSYKALRGIFFALDMIIHYIVVRVNIEV